MNVKTNEHRLGVALICVGAGIHLLILELVRLINTYAAKYYAAASEIYVLSCFLCSILIASGVILLLVHRTGIVVALIYGIVSFCLAGVCLFYIAYVVPFSQNIVYQASDWLFVSATCFVGISLVGWAMFNLIKRN